MEQAFTIFIVVVLGLAALLTILRIVRGPSALDRTVASEVLMTIVVCALGAEAGLARSTTTLPIVISLSLLGFIGSVAVVRFVSTDRDPGGAPVPGPVQIRLSKPTEDMRLREDLPGEAGPLRNEEGRR